MTVRAFTSGYDLFHPSETIVWHDYLRADARKHWGDHTEANSAPRSWSALDEASRRKVQRLLCGETIAGFGVGTSRTLEEYEAYAGLSFQRKRAQQYTLDAQIPPNPPQPPDWADRIYAWIVRVNVQRAQLESASFEDPALWYLGIRDDRGTELCRIDVSAASVIALDPAEQQISLVAEFHSGSIPSSWIVWPLSQSKGWLPKVEGHLQDADFAMLKEDDDHAFDESREAAKQEM